MSIEFGISVIVTIFAIVNPLGNVPFFVTITDGYPHEVRQRIIMMVCVVMIVVLFVFAIFGDLIFYVYGITIPAFRIAGGVLLFSIAFSMMQGRRPTTKITEAERVRALEEEQVGVVPLGIPMFAGPGSITTVMILTSDVQQSGDVTGYIWIFIGVMVTVILSYLILSYSDVLFRIMGRTGTMAFSRIMGLVLAAVAVQFIIVGVFQAIEEAGLI